MPVLETSKRQGLTNQKRKELRRSRDHWKTRVEEEERLQRTTGFKRKTREVKSSRRNVTRKVKNVMSNSREGQEKTVQKWSSETQRVVQSEERRREARDRTRMEQEESNSRRRPTWEKNTKTEDPRPVAARCTLRSPRGAIHQVSGVYTPSLSASSESQPKANSDDKQKASASCSLSVQGIQQGLTRVVSLVTRSVCLFLACQQNADPLMSLFAGSTAPLSTNSCHSCFCSIDAVNLWTCTSKDTSADHRYDAVVVGAGGAGLRAAAGLANHGLKTTSWSLNPLGFSPKTSEGQTQRSNPCLRGWRFMIKTTVCLTSSISMGYRQRHLAHHRLMTLPAESAFSSGGVHIGSRFSREEACTFQVMTWHFEESNFSNYDSLHHIPD